MVAARALRYVAGELRHSGLISSDEAQYLLHAMNFPATALPLVVPIPRPEFISRPAFDDTIWNEKDCANKWIDDVAEDTRPLPVLSDEKVIAEISTFEIHKVMRSTHTLGRVRAPFLEVGERDDFDDWVAMLPRAMWVGDFRATDRDPASTIVRRLVTRHMPEIPPFQLVICPNWLRRLGWRSHPQNWLVYRDGSGSVVARVIWWRDGGPVDVEEDGIWGEGVFVTVTPSGLAQLEALCGKLSITTRSHREVKPADQGTDPVTRSASSRE